MAMSVWVSTVPAPLSEAVSTVLKPAVRGVTAENSAASTRSPADSPAKAALRSVMKNSTAGTTISTIEKLSTSLLCSRYRRTCSPFS